MKKSRQLAAYPECDKREQGALGQIVWALGLLVAQASNSGGCTSSETSGLHAQADGCHGRDDLTGASVLQAEAGAQHLVPLCHGLQRLFESLRVQVSLYLKAADLVKLLQVTVSAKLRRRC